MQHIQRFGLGTASGLHTIAVPIQASFAGVVAAGGVLAAQMQCAIQFAVEDGSPVTEERTFLLVVTGASPVSSSWDLSTKAFLGSTSFIFGQSYLDCAVYE